MEREDRTQRVNGRRAEGKLRVLLVEEYKSCRTVSLYCYPKH